MSDEEIEKLAQDEVICYIARRYKTSSQNVLQRFLQQETAGVLPDHDRTAADFRLEDNEMEILRHLSGTI